MSDRQDTFVRAVARKDKFVPLSRVVESERQGEMIREMGDGTEMSLQERLEYAVSLIPRDRLEAAAGRSYKQIKRYLDGADVPFSVLTMLSVVTGVPVDWLAAGRPTWGPSDYDRWRVSLSGKTLDSLKHERRALKGPQQSEITTEIDSVKRLGGADENLSEEDPSTEVIARASRLRAAVQAAGGNQVVAARSGVPLSTLGTYLAGRDMKVAALIALADACEVCLEWLAKGTGLMKPGETEPGKAALAREPTLFGTLDMARLGNAIALADLLFAKHGRSPTMRAKGQITCRIYDRIGGEAESPAALISEILAMADQLPPEDE